MIMAFCNFCIYEAHIMSMKRANLPNNPCNLQTFLMVQIEIHWTVCELMDVWSKKNGWKSAFQSHRVVNAEQNPSNYHKIPHKFHIWKYICSMKWQTIQKPQNVANRKHPIFWVWICWKNISSCDRYLIVLLLTLKWNGKQNILHNENYFFWYAQFRHYFMTKFVKKLPMAIGIGLSIG